MPRPLDECSALNGDSEEDLASLFQALANHLGLKNSGPEEEAALKAKFEQLEKSATLKKSEALGWIGVPWDKAYIAVDGPVEGLSPREDEYAQDSMEARYGMATTKFVMETHGRPHTRRT